MIPSEEPSAFGTQPQCTSAIRGQTRGALLRHPASQHQPDQPSRSVQHSRSTPLTLGGIAKANMVEFVVMGLAVVFAAFIVLVGSSKPVRGRRA